MSGNISRNKLLGVGLALLSWAVLLLFTWPFGFAQGIEKVIPWSVTPSGMAGIVLIIASFIKGSLQKRLAWAVAGYLAIGVTAYLFLASRYGGGLFWREGIGFIFMWPVLPLFPFLAS